MVETWLPRLLFVATLLAAAGLAGAVGVAPWLLPAENPPRLLELFAQDATVRRTTLASAVALTVTAFVFFRPTLKKKPTPKPPASNTIAGA